MDFKSRSIGVNDADLILAMLGADRFLPSSESNEATHPKDNLPSVGRPVCTQHHFLPIQDRARWLSFSNDEQAGRVVWVSVRQRKAFARAGGWATRFGDEMLCKTGAFIR